MLWTVVGLKLAKLESNQDLPANQLRKYRGGMRVTDVREGSNAATNKFQKGDILVGLDKWETTSFENIKFVFDQPEVQAARSIKFYILRGSETLYGVIQWNNDEPSIGQFLLNQLTKPAEAKSPNSDDANKQSVTAAIIRAAEARRTLAALEYKRVIAANKQTPGATSNIEIERLKANLEIAEAELDAAKAGGDISRSDKPKPTTDGEPTFDGTAYSQWLKMLESERKPDKLATAIEACTRLAVVGDEQRIVRGIFVATRLFEVADNSNERNRVWDAATAALKRLPGEAVVAELLAALPDERFKTANDFQTRFLIAVTTWSLASENVRAAL